MNSYQTSKWEWVALEDAVEICDYLRKPVNSKERAQRVANKREDELYPYYGATGQVGYIDSYLSDGEYVLLGEDGAPFLDPFAKKAYLIKGKGWVNNHAHVLKSKLNNKFLCYYLNQVDYNGLVTGTTRYKLTQAAMKRILVPTPDLVEQERIVSKIEELFSKLDASVAELKTAKEKLKVYRQAVLKEAFTGFTQKGLVEISEIVEDIRIGPFGTMLHKTDYVSGGVPVINPQHIKKLSIIPSEKVTVSQEKYVELAPYQLKENDIIMGRRGEMGRAAAITKVEAGWICGTGSILFRLKPEYDATFYSQILSSPDAVHYLEDHATGTTMKNLNESIVKHIPVPKVTRQMQEEIVSKSEEKTSICDSIEQTIDASLQQAEALRQSILKQAFEGGL